MHPRILVAVNDGHMAESLQNSLDSHVFGYLPSTEPAEINEGPVLNLMKARPVLVLWVCVTKMVQSHVVIKFSHQDCLRHVELESAKEVGSKICISLNEMEFYF